jgi:hypothetical protein
MQIRGKRVHIESNRIESFLSLHILQFSIVSHPSPSFQMMELHSLSGKAKGFGTAGFSADSRFASVSTHCNARV